MLNTVEERAAKLIGARLDFNDPAACAEACLSAGTSCRAFQVHTKRQFCELLLVTSGESLYSNANWHTYNRQMFCDRPPFLTVHLPSTQLFTGELAVPISVAYRTPVGSASPLTLKAMIKQDKVIGRVMIDIPAFNGTGGQANFTITQTSTTSLVEGDAKLFVYIAQTSQASWASRLLPGVLDELVALAVSETTTTTSVSTTTVPCVPIGSSCRNPDNPSSVLDLFANPGDCCGEDVFCGPHDETLVNVCQSLVTKSPSAAPTVFDPGSPMLQPDGYYYGTNVDEDAGDGTDDSAESAACLALDASCTGESVGDGSAECCEGTVCSPDPTTLEPTCRASESVAPPKTESCISANQACSSNRVGNGEPECCTGTVCSPDETLTPRCLPDSSVASADGEGLLVSTTTVTTTTMVDVVCTNRLASGRYCDSDFEAVDQKLIFRTTGSNMNAQCRSWCESFRSAAGCCAMYKMTDDITQCTVYPAGAGLIVADWAAYAFAGVCTPDASSGAVVGEAASSSAGQRAGNNDSDSASSRTSGAVFVGVVASLALVAGVSLSIMFRSQRRKQAQSPDIYVDMGDNLVDMSKAVDNTLSTDISGRLSAVPSGWSSANTPRSPFGSTTPGTDAIDHPVENDAGLLPFGLTSPTTGFALAQSDGSFHGPSYSPLWQAGQRKPNTEEPLYFEPVPTSPMSPANLLLSESCVLTPSLSPPSFDNSTFSSASPETKGDTLYKKFLRQKVESPTGLALPAHTGGAKGRAGMRSITPTDGKAGELLAVSHIANMFQNWTNSPGVRTATPSADTVPAVRIAPGSAILSPPKNRSTPDEGGLEWDDAFAGSPSKFGSPSGRTTAGTVIDEPSFASAGRASPGPGARGPAISPIVSSSGRLSTVSGRAPSVPPPHHLRGRRRGTPATPYRRSATPRLVSPAGGGRPFTPVNGGVKLAESTVI